MIQTMKLIFLVVFLFFTIQKLPFVFPLYMISPMEQNDSGVTLEDIHTLSAKIRQIKHLSIDFLHVPSKVWKML